MKKLKVLDLFSGIGMFSHGLHQTGFFETVAFCEIDKDCQKVLTKHWPNVWIASDIKELRMVETPTNEFEDAINAELESVDIICGGFPCTDISVAGKQKGLIDEEGKTTRSGLWFEYLRLIQEIKPKYVLIENVSQLLNNGFTRVLKDLYECGYNAEWNLISARDIGANHLRKRLWIIAYPECIGQRRLQSGRWSGKNRAKEIWTRGTSETGEPSNTYNFRLWKSFTSQKEKFEWWTKTTSKFRSWWQTQPGVCGVDDGPPEGMDGRIYERQRKARIKQLGNALIPQIAQFLGERIMEYEKANKEIDEETETRLGK